MSDNRRNAYRVPFSARAEIVARGRSRPCTILNLSAGGVLIEVEREMQVGDTARLDLTLDGELQRAAGVPMLQFDLEVLGEAEHPTDDLHGYRCRHTAIEGDPQYEQARKVVFGAERAQRAAETGMGESSPMASDEQRRDQQRPERKPRYNKSSINPLHRDQG